MRTHCPAVRLAKKESELQVAWAREREDTECLSEKLCEDVRAHLTHCPFSHIDDDAK